MSKRFAVVLLALLCGAAGVTLYSQRRSGAVAGPVPSAAGGSVSFRILLGVNDRTGANWDGTIAVSPGRITEIRGWRFGGADSADLKSWKVATRPSDGKKGKAGGVLENGVVVTADAGEDARFEVRLAQGTFSFQTRELPFGGPKEFLQGKVVVDRAPMITQLTESAEEQDFPAMAAAGDAVYVSFVEFRHGDRAAEARRTFEEEPKSFDFLTRPVGGDQVMLLEYSKSGKKWGAPVAVSAAKQDVMRSAVAVDGQKRVWVIWSANVNGNLDLYAKYRSGGTWSREIRVTTNEGTDVNPVAAVDAQGRVWVAWQGYRNGSLDVLVAAQNGDSLGAESVVSSSKQSDWDASIAAAGNGEIAVSWDTYDKGDYDVWVRRMKWEGGVRMQPGMGVAVSRNFEARSSIAYDAKNRLWVAYEASETQWGKDFGAYETTGVALYQNHNLKVKCLEGNRVMETAGSLDEALAGASTGALAARRRRAAEQAAGKAMPNPELVKLRQPSATPQPPPMPMNSFPRLAADGDGGVYLSYRATTAARGPMGTTWMQEVARLRGDRWEGPITIPETDYWLDNRAAMAMIAPGHLMLVSGTDHRMSASRARRRAAAAGDAAAMIQADLIAAELAFGVAPAAQLKAASGVGVAAPDPSVAAERDQVSLMRNYRANVAGAGLQLMRGEFHRHTEMSGDGGRDGPLIDAYRYMIDAAYMDWGGCCDHDNGGGREYSWWLQQKLTDAYKMGSTFVPMFSYERSVRYPEGHRNVVMARRGVRPLPRLPKVADEAPPAPAPDTKMLYRYLREYGGIVASHTSGTNMGTDWRDNDPVVEPVVEIYQGDRQNYEMPGGPRSNNSGDSIGGWRPLGFVSLALQKGYKLGFQASSDHISTHMSYCNLWVTSPSREGVMEAFRKRRVYGATDNILADVRVGSHFMGEEFTVSEPPSIAVKLWGTDVFAKVHVIRDGVYVYTAEPRTKKVDFTWKDSGAVKGKAAYYYVRGEQADGEIVWVSPMWINYR
ncbi:MAG: hypothetical protein JST93_20770 [Acidobacteria bacterium]|nr:hypothetical protein [Acidobacteriota bacterium]